MKTYRPRVAEIKKKLQRALRELDEAAYPIPVTKRDKENVSIYVLGQMENALRLIQDAEDLLQGQLDRGEAWYEENQ